MFADACVEPLNTSSVIQEPDVINASPAVLTVMVSTSQDVFIAEIVAVPTVSSVADESKPVDVALDHNRQSMAGAPLAVPDDTSAFSLNPLE